MNAAFAWPQIVAGLERDRFDAPRQRRGVEEQVDVRGPHCSLDDRLVSRVTKQIAEQSDAIQPE